MKLQFAPLQRILDKLKWNERHRMKHAANKKIKHLTFRSFEWNLKINKYVETKMLRLRNMQKKNDKLLLDKQKTTTTNKSTENKRTEWSHGYGNWNVDAPPTGQPASSLGGPPTTSTTPSHAISGTLLIVGIVSGTSLVLINILIIGCCLHKRNTKQIKRGKWLYDSRCSTAWNVSRLSVQLFVWEKWQWKCRMANVWKKRRQIHLFDWMRFTFDLFLFLFICVCRLLNERQHIDCSALANAFRQSNRLESLWAFCDCHLWSGDSNSLSLSRCIFIVFN